MAKAKSSGARVLISFLFVGLAGANWHALTEEIDTSPIRRAVSTQLITPAAEPRGLSQASLAELHETTERPLFSPTRRPLVKSMPGDVASSAAAQQEGPQGEASHLPNVKLLGTLRAGKEKTRALLIIQDAAAAGWIDVGADVGGWRLSVVETDFVVLEALGAKTTVTLYPQKIAAQ
jgi:hypothetical protein